jgi:uncharacterized membrane protein
MSFIQLKKDLMQNILPYATNVGAPVIELMMLFLESRGIDKCKQRVNKFNVNQEFNIS